MVSIPAQHTLKKGFFVAFEWMPKFLESLSEVPNVSAACRNSGVSRRYAYVVKDKDKEFGEAWEDAIEASTDELVGTCYKRAKEGSDVLAIFLLKAHRRPIYGDKSEQQVISKNEHSVQLNEIAAKVWLA